MDKIGDRSHQPPSSAMSKNGKSFVVALSSEREIVQLWFVAVRLCHCQVLSMHQQNRTKYMNLCVTETHVWDFSCLCDETNFCPLPSSVGSRRKITDIFLCLGQMTIYMKLYNHRIWRKKKICSETKRGVQFQDAHSLVLVHTSSKR